MNADQEQRLLDHIEQIKFQAEMLCTAVCARPIPDDDDIATVKDLLRLIADRVAPPVKEPPSDPPTTPTELARGFQILHDDVATLYVRVDQIDRQLRLLQDQIHEIPT